MASFEHAFEHIIKAEGLFVNHPADKGGPTQYGLTQRTYSAFLGRTASIADMKRMSLQTAKLIYRTNYWDVLGLSQLPPGLALCVFDQAVNRSPHKAAITLQSVLRVTQDGKIGPETLTAIASHKERDLCWDFCRESITTYARIVQNNPTQLVFFNGWLNRVFTLIEAHALV